MDCNWENMEELYSSYVQHWRLFWIVFAGQPVALSCSIMALSPSSVCFCGPGEHSQYSDLLQAAWYGDQILVGDFLCPSGQALGPIQPPTSWVLCLSGGEGGSGWGVALTTHPHLAPRWKKGWSYTCTPFLCLHGLYWGELYLYFDASSELNDIDCTVEMTFETGNSQFEPVEQDDTWEHVEHHIPEWASASRGMTFAETCVFIATVENIIWRTVVFSCGLWALAHISLIAVTRFNMFFPLWQNKHFYMSCNVSTVAPHLKANSSTCFYLHTIECWPLTSLCEQT